MDTTVEINFSTCIYDVGPTKISTRLIDPRAEKSMLPPIRPFKRRNIIMTK